MSLVRPLLVSFALLSVITGVIYPLAVTGIGKMAFAQQSAGSLIRQGNEVVGSALIGQSFADPGHFWGRLSATAPNAYNAGASGGSNFATTNPALLAAARARIDALLAGGQASPPVPVDLVTASASGLDPDISPAAALYQVARVARARGLDPARVRQLVLTVVEGPQWGVFGEPRVNVLLLNLQLDRTH